MRFECKKCDALHEIDEVTLLTLDRDPVCPFCTGPVVRVVEAPASSQPAGEPADPWFDGATLAYRERGLDPEAAAAKATWLRAVVGQRPGDPPYLWEGAPSPETSASPGAPGPCCVDRARRGWCYCQPGSPSTAPAPNELIDLRCGCGVRWFTRSAYEQHRPYCRRAPSGDPETADGAVKP